MHTILYYETVFTVAALTVVAGEGWRPILGTSQAVGLFNDASYFKIYCILSRKSHFANELVAVNVWSIKWHKR